MTNDSCSAFGSAANGSNIDERTAQKLLAEEEAAMEKFRFRHNFWNGLSFRQNEWNTKYLDHDHIQITNCREKAPASNPFAAAPEPGPEETPNILDLFGVGGGGAVADAVGSQITQTVNYPQSITQAPAAPSDDLLQLQGNPFANMMNGEHKRLRE